MVRGRNCVKCGLKIRTYEVERERYKEMVTRGSIDEEAFNNLVQDISANMRELFLQKLMEKKP